MQGFSSLHRIPFESSGAAKTINHVIDVGNRKEANFVYDLDTKECSMCDSLELLQIRQHTGILVNGQVP